MSATLPVWRLLGRQAVIPVDYWKDPRLWSVMQRAIAEPSCLQELDGYDLALKDYPTHHVVHAVPPILFVSSAFVRAVSRGGYELPVVKPRLRVGNDSFEGYVIPILRCRTEWLDLARSEIKGPNSVLTDVWLPPPHEEAFLRQPETRIINVTNGIFQALVDDGLIDVEVEAERCCDDSEAEAGGPGAS